MNHKCNSYSLVLQSRATVDEKQEIVTTAVNTRKKKVRNTEMYICQF